MNKALMRFRSNKFIPLAIVVLIFLAVGLYYSMTTKMVPPKAPVVSERALEEEYGLRVNLVAVTAMGGMVDLRLKIIDPEKAKLLLADRANFPSLYVSDTDVTLNVDEDVKTQEIRFEEDGNLFLLYPNSGNAVQPGTPVHIRFGNTMELEPVEAR